MLSVKGKYLFGVLCFVCFLSFVEGIMECMRLSKTNMVNYETQGIFANQERIAESIMK